MTDINKVRDELADQFTYSAAGNAERCMECGYHTIVKVEDAFKAGFDAAIAHLSKQSAGIYEKVMHEFYLKEIEDDNNTHSAIAHMVSLWQHQQTALIYEAKLAIAVEALKDANDKCRSAASIASREGRDTSWTPFRERLNESLAFQHEALEIITKT